jgi:hypothetical protein
LDRSISYRQGYFEIEQQSNKIAYKAERNRAGCVMYTTQTKTTPPDDLEGKAKRSMRYVKEERRKKRKASE